METAAGRRRTATKLKETDRSSNMEKAGIEKRRCDEYLQRAKCELDFSEWLRTRRSQPGLIVSQGFEERSVGIIERLAETNTEVPSVVINRYLDPYYGEINSKYQDRFERAAEKIAAGHWHLVENDYDGQWVYKAVKLIDTEEVIIDITAISNRGLFCALDAIAASGKKIWIAYTEAKEYWPKESDWKQLSKEISGYKTLADIVDEKPWLSGYQHRVELIPMHEGYDSARSGRALIGFLTFKRARLAAVLGEEDYEECLFIAGRPRLHQNQWRLTALKKINESLIKEWPVKTMDTFGYLKTLKQLSSLLLRDESLLARYNVHLAPMGSKLQTVGSWILSSIVPSITMVASVPSRYYPKAFSDGIGANWIFPLTLPKK